MQLKGRVCLVTGGSSGIGKATALALANQGAEVIIVNHNLARGEAALQDIRSRSGNSQVHLMLADLSSQDEIRKLAADFESRFERLDVLVNVAGTLFFKRQLSDDGLEMNLALNYLGYFLLTELLLDKLVASAPARIVNVTSVAHWWGRLDFDDLQSERHYNMFTAYGKSKLAIILFTRELARRLEGSGVTVNCIHPGIVATHIVERVIDSPLIYRLARLIFLSPADAAAQILYLVSSPEVDGVSGEYFIRKSIAASSKRALDENLAQRLWQASESLTDNRVE
jgi:NAD(P)-dependent dehydrogenase (short-subunit alcohol dehydrogenase family)